VVVDDQRKAHWTGLSNLVGIDVGYLDASVDINTRNSEDMTQESNPTSEESPTKSKSKGKKWGLKKLGKKLGFRSGSSGSTGRTKGSEMDDNKN
jgi:hypothetical protein